MTMPRYNNDHGRIVNAAIVRAAELREQAIDQA